MSDLGVNDCVGISACLDFCYGHKRKWVQTQTCKTGDSEWEDSKHRWRCSCYHPHTLLRLSLKRANYGAPCCKTLLPQQPYFRPYGLWAVPSDGAFRSHGPSHFCQTRTPPNMSSMLRDLWETELRCNWNHIATTSSSSEPCALMCLHQHMQLSRLALLSICPW